MPFVEVPAPLAEIVKAPWRAPARNSVAVRHAMAALRPIPTRNGRSNLVVQLGAYANPQRVAAAWNAAARSHGGLRAYTPMSARFTSARGPVYRLAVRGFASFGEANALCVSLRRSGGSCFVRNFAGDAPVQIAMR
jgi:cell division septation protein DedD